MWEGCGTWEERRGKSWQEVYERILGGGGRKGMERTGIRKVEEERKR